MNESELPQEPFSLEQFSAELSELIGQYFESQNERDKIQIVPKILLEILRAFKKNPDERASIILQIKKALEPYSEIKKCKSSDLYSALSTLANELEASENSAAENIRQIKEGRESVGSIL